MLKFCIEISSIIVSFILIFLVIIRLPKEIVGLGNSKKKQGFLLKSINKRILLFVLYLILILIFLNIKI